METNEKKSADAFTVNVLGFTYIKDYAFITIKVDDKPEKVIIGLKSEFPMRDMFALKDADSITLVEKEPKTSNNVTYRRFKLESINF